MKKEIKSMLGKTAKIGCATCVAAGAIAVMTSGVALKTIGEGGKYMADVIKRIVKEENSPAEEAAAANEDFASPAAETAGDTI